MNPGISPFTTMLFGKVKAAHLRRLFLQGDQGIGAQICVTAAGLAYTAFLGLAIFLTPKDVRFDLLFLLGSIAVGWAAGARAGLVIACASTCILFYHEQRLANGVSWIVYINSVIRVLAYATISWMADGAGRLTRNLEKNVAERTARLQSEVEKHKETSDYLGEAIELFRHVTDNISDVFWVTDPGKAQVEYISPGFEKVWGKSCAELYASPVLWFQGIHMEDRQRVTQAMLSRQVNGQYDEEYRVVRPDGVLRWVHDRAFPVKDRSGAVYRIVGIAEDITERKCAERLLQAERDLGAMLSSTSDLKFAVDCLMNTAMQLDGIDCGGVYLIDRETGELLLEAHRGLAEPFVERIRRYKSDAMETRLARAGRSLYVGHDQIPRNLQALWGSEGLRALAVVPLQHKGAVLGMLNLASFKEDQIPSRMRVGIELIASQVAAAFARISAEQQILEISDREQARIGQDVHDGLCQQLVGAAFMTNSLERALASQDRPETLQAQKISRLIDEAITESRRVARGLYPVRLTTEGLGPALEELAASINERFGIHCHCQAANRPQCDTTTATHLYRIAQEAVNNAVKHSGAKNIQIRLSDSRDHLLLEIKDDGKGMKSSTEPRMGMGLYIMDYRARSLGATFRVASDPGGTAVSCSLPLKELLTPNPE